MKKMLRPAGALLLLSALFMPAAHAYLTVVGNAAAPATFLSAPNRAIFYRPTGEYYFGLAAGGVSLTTGNYAISYGNYRTPDVAPTLTPIATSALISALNVGNLAVVSSAVGGPTSPTIVSTVGAIATTGILTAITKTNLTPVQTGTILDAAGTVTPSIRGLCAANDYISPTSASLDVAFAAVKVVGGGAISWGAGAGATTGLATGDGIQAVLMGRSAAGVPAFTAIGGVASGGNAYPFDLTVTGSYLYQDAATAAGGALTVEVGANGTRYGNQPAMWYDSILNRLYVGVTINQTAGNNTANASGSVCSIGMYPVVRPTTTTIAIGAVGAQLPMVTDAANSYPFGSLATSAITFPAAIQKVSNAGGAQRLGASAQMIRTMHTSTGFVYMIINGGTALGSANPAALALATADNVYALPLVGPAATTATNVGKFANIQDPTYLTPAGGAADTFALTTSAMVQVGGNGILPIDVATPVAGANSVSDMFVDNDTVYVAIGQNGGASTYQNNPGVYKSQALFDEVGRIASWTDWQRVVPNDMVGNAVPGTGQDGRTDFVAVDGYTGHVWTTNTTSLQSNVTQWTQTAPAINQQSGLPAAVNAALPGGLCYSVLDLNTSVTGWGATTPSRVTMFGGQERVCFAITGSGGILPVTANGVYNQTNSVLQTTGAGNVYDYTSTQTFFTTSLPAGAGAVISLAFSGWNLDTATGTTVGFFFAGCNGTEGVAPGLYAWAITGANLTASTGFNPFTVLNDFRNAPWVAGTTGTTNSWQLIPNVQGEPVKIESLGGGLHVLTRTAGLDRIYSAAKQANLNALNTSFVVTASSGVAPSGTNSSLASVSQIYDFVISVSATPAAATPAVGVEQLLMLTNDGIYTTSSLTGMQSPSTVATQAQLQAGWFRIAAPISNGLLTDYIGQPRYTRNPETFWFGNWTVNPIVPDVFNNYIWYQMSRYSFTGGTSATVGTQSLADGYTYNTDPSVTATFNGASSFNQTTAPTIYATFPVNARLFYNDGSRRFFVQKNPTNDSKYQVLVLPYNLYDYNITANGKTVMSDAAVAQAGAFYWMSPIGDTGRLMMGTSNGVVALQ